MKDWQYDIAPDLEQSFLERVRRFPREPDMLVYTLRALAALAIRAALRIYHRLEVVGRERLPASGSFVLVANHASHLDAMVLTAVLPLRKLHRAFPAAAADYFFTSVPRTFFAAVVVNALPFSRRIRIGQSLELCRRLLANPGNILVLFPEGTRSVTGAIGLFKPGIGALVAGTDVPVLPCHIAGAFRAWPKGRWFPSPRKIRLLIGEARRYTDRAATKESAMRIAAELEQAVRELEVRHAGS